MRDSYTKSPYLHDIPLGEAKTRFRDALQEKNLWGVLADEDIQLDESAVGRVLSAPIWAKISSPNYNASAMDGFAVRSPDTKQALLTNAISLEIGNQAVYVDTGDPLPDWADGVIPIENVEPIDISGNPAADARHPHAIRVRAAVTPWNHVRTMGEDIVATELVIPAGHVLRPVDLGAIAACGHDKIRVSQRPIVAIIPTGNELVAVGQPIEEGQIIEFNSIVLAAQIESWGGQPQRHKITADEFDSIQRVVEEASQTCDLILLNAGSSAGSEDYSAEVIASLGELLVHGVAVRPGHPVILGVIENATRSVPIIGVPGYPVSAALTGEIFIEPLLAKWLGRSPFEPTSIRAKITRKVVSPAGDDDYMRVAVGKVGDHYLAAPLSRGAGVITSLVEADGIAILPRGIQGLPAGAEVDVRLYRTPDEIDRTIFAIGSHDLTLDLLSQYLSKEDRRLTSANVGSLAGLVALRRGEAHLAGSHLLDPDTGQYNLTYIKQYLAEQSIIVVGFVDRQQGLIVQRGNPKQLSSLNDIVINKATFVNRQHGAGTRVLLDHQLNSACIASDSIRGYNHEEYTHLAVAAAVKSGRADCGLGIAAAAEALDLDFIPLFPEEYDLIIPVKYYSSDLLAPLLRILADEDFKNQVNTLPGYDVTRMGNIKAKLG